MTAPVLAGCLLAAGCLSGDQAPAAQAPDSTTDDAQGATDAAMSFIWKTKPADGKLLPGAQLEWVVVGREVGDEDVVLETPEGSQTLCAGTSGVCWLPAELRESTTYQWWVRARTDQGIVRSPSFSFKTPATGLTITAAPPSRLGPYGGFAWSVTGGSSAAQLAVLTPMTPGASFVCENPRPSCATGTPLVAGETYEAEVRAYDERGLYALKNLGRHQADRPPAPPQPAQPRPGAEEAAGSVTLAWSDALDPEGGEVQYRVEYFRAGTWQERDVGRELRTLISVNPGERVLWRVIATDAIGNEVTSPYAHFHTPDAPPAALLTSPILDLRVPPRAPVTFEWIPQTEGSQRVEWRPTSGDWAEACMGFRSCTATLPLSAGKAYEWRVTTDADYYGQAVSSVAAFSTVEPVVLVHGVLSDGTTWGEGGGELAKAGYEVIDFTPSPGLQLLSYTPASDHVGIQSTALAVRAQLDAALSQAGYPRGTSVAIVGHSLGGLVGRVISDQPGDYPVEMLITLGTPHLGSTTGAILDSNFLPTIASRACAWILNVFIPGAGLACPLIVRLVQDYLEGHWDGVIRELVPQSDFISSLNARPSTVEWRSIAGDSDMLVSVGSATYHAADSRIIPAGHTSLPQSPQAMAAVEEWLTEGPD